MNTMRRRSPPRFWAVLLGYVTLALLALGAAASCGGGGAPAGACTMDATNTGCTAGQLCQAGKDGKLACFCSITADTGCADGKACLADATGAPACFCNR